MSWRVIWIPELLGAVLGGIFVFRLGMGTMPKTVLHACEEFTGMLRESRRYENWVTGTEKKLRKNGAKFHYGKKITPVKYLLMRLFLSLGGRKRNDHRKQHVPGIWKILCAGTVIAVPEPTGQS
jgi:hypothetical protein